MGRKPGHTVLSAPTAEFAEVSGQLSLDGAPPAKLKPRVEEFCWEFTANGGNASAAYRKAFKTSNSRVSHANASRLLRDPAVGQRIREISCDRSHQLAVLTDRLLEYLTAVLCLDRSDFLDATGRFRPLSELPPEALMVLDLKSVVGKSGEAEALPSVPTRIEAARELARILGMYTDRLQVAAAIAVEPIRRVERLIVEP